MVDRHASIASRLPMASSVRSMVRDGEGGRLVRPTAYDLFSADGLAPI